MPCHGNRLSRRGFLTSGCAAGLGLGLAELLSLQAAQANESASAPVAQAQNVIQIFLPGGMAQQESLDPKPYAPLEYRGDLGTVKTNTGEVFCNTMPKLAKVADKFTVIRSMTHTEAAHERGTHTMFTGYAPSPALVYPSMGSVVNHELGTRNNLPAYVCIPNEPNEFAGRGYLSSAFGPFSLGSDPARGDFQVRDLHSPAGVDEERAAHRRKVLEAVNFAPSANTADDGVQAMNTFYERAFSLLDSAAAREAFNIGAEPKELRDRYGRNEAGQRMLMAKRLVKAGVRLVTLTYGAWDMHLNLTPAIRRQMPPLDKALAALIADLDAEGLLDSTVVLLSTEFGRTPKRNNTRGRDHWPKVFSVAVAGGGFQRGLTYGASNATAAEVDDNPVSPADLMATIYQQLGIDHGKELIAPGNRPIEIVKGGRIIPELLT